MMKRRYYLVPLMVIVSVGIVVGFHVTGYLFNDQRIIPPVSSVELEEVQDGGSESSSGSGSPPMLILTEQLKEVPGIKNIRYELFVSSESMDQVLAYYTNELEKEGYAYHEEYSGMQTYNSAEVFYHAFAKGLNGVVIFLSEYNHQTWVCYSTGNVLQYQRIFDYMTSHGILQ